MNNSQVQAYLQRIGLAADFALAPTLACLQTLHQHHVFSVPFENLDIHAGKPIEIDFARLYEKIVVQKRGGYCFESNALFGKLLQAVGFQITFRGGRVWYGFELDCAAEDVRPRTHQLLEISLDGKHYLADVAFGNGIVLPLLLQAEIEQEQFGRRFRMQKNARLGRLIQQWVGDQWLSLYSFSNEIFYPQDYELANFYTSHHPASRFTRGLICAMPTAEGRIALVDKELTIKHGDREEKITVNTLLECKQLLRQHFALDLPAEMQLRPFSA